MTERVDVALSAYGKPAQTAVTLASLHRHSGQHIDRVFFSEEREQPYGDTVGFIPACFPEMRFVHEKPPLYLGWGRSDHAALGDPDHRISVRYQRAWEMSSRRCLFVTHNDCMFTEDIIGGMLGGMAEGPYTGVGSIGQCWNCPASMDGLCGGDRQEHFRPDYDFVRDLVSRRPSPRTTLDLIDPVNPMPLPECRLNEFACLIDMDACRAQVMPQGDVVPFGFMGLDTGTDWFRGLVLRGHRFLHRPGGFVHAQFSRTKSGHASNFLQQDYVEAEHLAFQYLQEEYPTIAERFIAAQSQTPRPRHSTF